MKSRRKRKIIIGILACIMVIMGIGYAIFTQTINITAGGHIKSKFSIYIDSITPIDIYGNAEAVSEEILEDKLSAAIQADFYNPGDFVEYNVVVKNDGSVNTKLTKVNFNLDRDSEYISFSSKDTENRVLNAHSQIEFTVKIKFDEVENFTKPEETLLSSGEMQLIFTQYEGEPVEDPEEPVSPTPVVPEGDWIFKVNSEGLITDYNYKYGNNVKVPYSVDGIVIKEIDRYSFSHKTGDIVLYIVENDDEEEYLLLFNNKEKRDEIYNAFLELMCEGPCPDDFDISEYYKIYDDEEELNDYISDNGFEIYLSEPMMYTNGDFEDPISTIEKLDLSEATGLELIKEESFAAHVGRKADGECPSDTIGDTCNFGNLKELILPNKNISIGDLAFQGNKLTSLVIPEGVTYIPQQAFCYNNISSLTLPSTLVSISSNAFYSNYLTHVDLPDSLTYIGEYAFTNNLIFDVEIPENISYISYGTFSNNMIESITIPSNITRIDSKAFENNMITSLTIPNTVTSIGSEVFKNNRISNLTFEYDSKLTNIQSGAFQNNMIYTLNIPSSVTNISSDAFDNNNISKLVIPDNVATIQNGAFTNNNFITATDITVLYNGMNVISRFNSNWNDIGFPGSGPTGIKYGCFFVNVNDSSMITGYNSDDITCPKNVSIPSEINGVTITSIGDNAFKEKGIERVVIPNTITSIGSYAFYGNEIINITIPASVTTIGNAAFKNNNSEHVTIEANETNLVNRFDSNWKHIFDPGTYNDRPICFTYTLNSGEATITGYDNICSKNVVIPQSIDGYPVKEIGANAFYNKLITSVSLPEGLERIGQYAFYASSSSNGKITELQIPSTVTSIGQYAFYYNKIEQLTIPASVTTIESYAFGRNNPLSYGSDSSVVTVLYNETNHINRFNLNWGNIGFPGSGPTYAKVGCFFVDPNDVHQIVGYDYENSSCPKNVVIPESLNGYNITSIADNAFLNNGLTGLILSDNLVTIGKGAFKNNDIEILNVPTNVKTIGESSFENNELSSLTFDSNRSSTLTINEKAFLQNSLTSLSYPDGTIIKGRAFSKNFFVGVINGTAGSNSASWIFRGFPLRSQPNNTYGNECFSVNTAGDTITSYDPNCGAEVVIPNEIIEGVPITKIDGAAFANTGITSVTMPNTITFLGEYSFYDNFITTVVYSSNLKYIDSFSFEYNFITNLTNLPDSVDSIGGEAFRFNLITDLKIPESFTTAVKAGTYGILYTGGTDASSWLTFSDNLLTSVTIPYTMQNTGVSTFANNMINEINIENTTEHPSQLKIFGGFYNNQLTSLTIPYYVEALAGDYGRMSYTRIYEDSRYNFSSYSSICDTSTSQYNDFGCFLQANPDKYLYEERIDDSSSRTVDPLGLTIDPQKTYMLSYYYLYSTFGYNQITSLTFEDSVEHPAKIKIIPTYCFVSNRISSLTLPNSVLVVDNKAFSMNAIQTLNLSNNLLYIGGYAFAFNKISSLTIPSSVDIIGNNAFNNNCHLTASQFDLNYDSSSLVCAARGGIYNYNETISTLVINDSSSSPSNLTVIGDSAFKDQKITNVIIPASVLTLGSYSFYETSNSRVLTVNSTIRYNDINGKTRLDSQISSSKLNGTRTYQYVNY